MKQCPDQSGWGGIRWRWIKFVRWSVSCFFKNAPTFNDHQRVLEIFHHIYFYSSKSVHAFRGQWSYTRICSPSHSFFDPPATHCVKCRTLKIGAFLFTYDMHCRQLWRSPRRLSSLTCHEDLRLARARAVLLFSDSYRSTFSCILQFWFSWEFQLRIEDITSSVSRHLNGVHETRSSTPNVENTRNTKWRNKKWLITRTKNECRVPITLN